MLVGWWAGWFLYRMGCLYRTGFYAKRDVYTERDYKSRPYDDTGCWWVGGPDGFYTEWVVLYRMGCFYTKRDYKSRFYDDMHCWRIIVPGVFFITDGIIWGT